MDPSFFLGFVTGVLANTVLSMVLVKAFPRVLKIVRARRLRPQYHRTHDRVLTREQEAAEWVRAFHEANPPINMNTPEGRALAQKYADQENLPRWERRALGLLEPKGF